MTRDHGFTMVEMAIVLVIIGLILGGILGAQSVVQSMQAKDVITIADDLRTATTYFKQRYGYLPGDLPAPATYITAVPALAQGTGGAIGNGAIDGAVNVTGQATAGSEVGEAPWQLFNAGLISKVDAGDNRRRVRTAFGPVHIVSVATANGLVPGYAAQNPTVRNAIVFTNLPCEIAREVDLKVDDGALNLGRGMASLGINCPDGSITNFYAIAL